jgi:ElaB/YqjD/DUF883 family membrane-anchored ribosome-binding protein
MTSDTLAVIEQDEIRHQIDESRSALVEKLGLLEEKVAETVQNASSSMAEATATVVDTVNQATASVSETVENVNLAVQGTVHNVQNAVSNTVDSVKDTFDLPEQVRRHPWEMLAGAVVIGYASGCFFSRRSTTGQNRSVERWEQPWPVDYGRPERGPTSLVPTPNRVEVDSASPKAIESRPEKTHLLSDMFGGELQKLQGLAIGVTLGLVRDLIAESAPASFRPQIEEVIDGFTEKLGGEHIRGPVLQPRETSSTT